MIEELINNVFTDINIKAFALKRPTGVFPCVVYNYKEFEGQSSDNSLESEIYEVFLNLYTKDNINNLKNKIKNALRSKRFFKITVNQPVIFDKTDYFQVVFTCKKKINI